MSAGGRIMLYPKSKEPQLSSELFQNPTSEYRATPFWAWNCQLEKEELLQQLETFKKWVWAVPTCTCVPA